MFNGIKIVSIRCLSFLPQNASRSQNLQCHLQQVGKDQHVTADRARREQGGLEFLGKKEKKRNDFGEKSKLKGACACCKERATVEVRGKAK